MTVEEAARRAFRDIPAARVATLDPRGAPHLAALWFVWREDALYFSVRQGGATWRNAEADPRVAVVIDRGRDWSELSGVRLEGFAHVFAAEHPDVRAVMSGWHEKYRSMLSGKGFEAFAGDVPSLGFLRFEPAAIDPLREQASRAVVRSRRRP